MNIKEELLKLLKVVVDFSTATPFRFTSNKYMCFYCCWDFNASSALLNHTKTEHKGQNLRSLLRTFPKNPRVKLDVTGLACKPCDKSMKDLKEFVDHAIGHHRFKIDKEILNHVDCFKLSNDELSCLECGEKFKFFKPLLRHVHEYHNELTFLCEICGKGFSAQRCVDQHVKLVHTNPGTLPCKKCKEVFPTLTKLKTHVENAHKLHKLKCPKCPESFQSRYMKKRHLALEHDVKDFQYPCKECGMTFVDKSKLVKHSSSVHAKEKNVTCHICGFKSFDMSYLKRHLVSHSEVRRFECEYCKKTFQRKPTLELHLRIHKDDRRYVCKECGKAFVQVTSLKVHSRTHHSKK